MLGDGPGIFPMCPFPLSEPLKSTYEEKSRKGPRHNLDLSRKKWETPPVWKPPGLASLNNQDFHSCYRTPDPRRVSQKKGLRRVSEGVSEGFLKSPCTCQPKDPSKPLQNAFNNPLKTFQEGVGIDDALGFPGASNQFLDQGPGVL